MPNSGLVENKTAVITGASSGLGRAMALRFARGGADVVVADLRSEPREGGTPTHEMISETTDAAGVYVDCDVTDKDDIAAAVDRADDLGGVDVMINNAGIFALYEFVSVTEADFDQMVSVNQKGVFFGCQIAAERMLRGDGGCILNMSSIVGLRGTAETSLYAMTKGGVRLLTYALAAELGPEGIRVNALHPGIVRTSMTTEDESLVGDDESEREQEERIGLRRVGEPEDVADVALFLASDLGSYVNGESISVDGGMANFG